MQERSTLTRTARHRTVVGIARHTLLVPRSRGPWPAEQRKAWAGSDGACLGRAAVSARVPDGLLPRVRAAGLWRANSSLIAGIRMRT